MALLEQFYKELLTKFHLKQVKENFAKASEIHERLLRNPAKPRKEPWILNSQARDELTTGGEGDCPGDLRRRRGHLAGLDRDAV